MAWRGALSKSFQELRVHLDQAGAASQGARDFLLANYAEMKKANPHFPILVRESAGVEAKLIARYDRGVERSVSIQNDGPEAIISKLQSLLQPSK
ncbi:L51_S25_CI-B8 domain-containing protein, partial [Haematococcus lacustris]